jgi:hypothetical protein
MGSPPAPEEEAASDPSHTVNGMLTFNQLLATAGIDPKDTRLARHIGRTAGQTRLMRDLAFKLDGGFALYQERQVDPKVIGQFRSARFIAGFVAEPLTKQTVFAGVWDRQGERNVLVGDPISGATNIDRPGAVEFVTQRQEQFDPYVGRLVIDWGDGTRAWVQHADKRDKSIIELRREKSEPEYPGHLALRVELGEVEGLYSNWVSHLRHSRGIYLLVHRASGQQYVGSATGANGFYGRWCNYADGHGGNLGMKELGAPAADLDATILEVAGSDASDKDIYDRESLWKDKLGSKVTGLNRN